MNKARRSVLAIILGRMGELATAIEEVKEGLQRVLDVEEEALGNLPDSLQEGERGQQMQEYIDSLEEVIDSLNELEMDNLHQTIEDMVNG